MRIATYGSLRKGEYNFDAFQKEFPGQIEFVETTVLDGYELYSLGAYPAAIKGEGELIVDILEVTPEVKHHLDMMEEGANYSIETIEVFGEPATFYEYQGHVSEQVIGGDWCNRHVETRNRYQMDKLASND